MKLLLDEHLSAELVESLADLYPGSEQVLTSGLGGAGDGVVWEYARLHGLTIVSKDSDFYYRSAREGVPPKVIWIQLGNCSTNDVERLLRSRYEAVRGFRSKTRRLVWFWGAGIPELGWVPTSQKRDVEPRPPAYFMRPSSGSIPSFSRPLSLSESLFQISGGILVQSFPLAYQESSARCRLSVTCSLLAS